MKSLEDAYKGDIPTREKDQNAQRRTLKMGIKGHSSGSCTLEISMFCVILY